MQTENEILGEKIAALLGLKPIARGTLKGRYDTSYGTKTLEGLGATVKRIVRESEYPEVNHEKL